MDYGSHIAKLVSAVPVAIIYLKNKNFLIFLKI